MGFEHTKYSSDEILLLKEMAITQKAVGFNMENEKSRHKNVNENKIVGSANYGLKKQHAPIKKEPVKQQDLKTKVLSISKKISIFKNMSPQEIITVTSSHKFESLKDGKEILTYGNTSDRLYFIVHGEVGVVNYDNGNINMDQIIDAHHIINLSSYITNDISDNDFIASGANTEIYSFAINEKNLTRLPIAYFKLYKNIALVLA